MKRLSPLLILMLSFLGTLLSGQNFAPLGATWHYTERHGFYPDIRFIKIEAVKDTVFQGEACRILQKNTTQVCAGRNLKEYVFSRGDTVFAWDNNLLSFQPITVYNNAVNSFWEFDYYDLMDATSRTMRVTVDSASYQLINNDSLRVMHVSYQTQASGFWPTRQSRIVERLGDLRYLFNFGMMRNCDGNFSAGLRCYQDSDIGFYSTQQYASCEYTNLGLPNAEQTEALSFYPNPVEGELHISNTGTDPYPLLLVNTTGRLICRTIAPAGDSLWDLSDLPPGIYFLKRERANNWQALKLIKK